jgi:hypothetical protein
MKILEFFSHSIRFQQQIITKIITMFWNKYLPQKSFGLRIGYVYVLSYPHNLIFRQGELYIVNLRHHIKLSIINDI